MSRSRRNFSAEFKTNLVLQLLKGEKELNVLAVENDIQPNLLRNWKKEFLANASQSMLISKKQEKPSEGISTPITLKDAISPLGTNGLPRYTIR